ncbi:Inorganic pyrophosphatase 2 [Bienertia sinuspersici]
MEGIMVVFDFDETILDCDSDNWVIDELGFTELYNKLLNTMPYNSMMDTLMKEMHAKGVTINDIVQHRTKKIIYIGDGKGDYCPSLKLREGDHVMPRKNFPVYDLITSNPMLIRATVHEWADGKDLERVLLSVIRGIDYSKDGNSGARLFSHDSKL